MRLRIIPLLFLLFNFYQASAQNNNCSNAILLCAPNPAPGSTITGSPDTVTVDPVLPCGDGVVHHSVWFTVQGINVGTAIIDLTNIDNNPGLSISAYTGTCGSLVPIPGACSSANGPGGSTSISFATAPGVTYYIMIDGEAGNQETFTIAATTPDNGIMSRPTPTFDAIPFVTCVPDSVTLQNTTQPNGPTTYQWRLCGTCPLIASSGADTTIYFGSAGAYDISLVATNSCGSRTQTQTIYIQDLVPAIVYSPLVTCIGQPVSFTGNASIQPQSIPPTTLNVVGWFWDFGDPLSGPNNTSTLQNPTHVFVGSGPSFTVTLVVDGTCGPDTTTIVVTLLPPPVVTATAGSPACQLAPVSLFSAIDSNATPPVTYQWSGPGTITCPTCDSTTATGLPPGGPYVYTVTITDANGCTATSSASVFINPLPVANAGNDTTVCRNSPVTLNGTPSGGTPPYTYAWTPGWGLSDSTIANPVAIVTVDTTYCLVVTDSFGCASLPDCVDLNVFPPPTVSVPPSLCATDPAPLQSTFTVSGAGAGSTYEWYLSTDYNYITSANVDSSSVTATYPSVPASYDFTVIVTDGVTGCIDTLNVSYTINPGLNMTISPADTICAGSSSALTATGATTYAWTASPPYVFADSTLASQTVSPAVTTTFTVLGTTGTCTQTLSTTVTVNPTPVAVAAPIPPFCGCMTVSLNGTGSTPGMSYLWSSAALNPILSPTSLVTSADICSSDVFMLVVTDTTTGCSDTATTSANSTPKPAATASVAPDSICDGVSTPVSLNGTGSDTTAGTTYLWTSSPPVPIADTTALVTTATVSTTTTFTLTVTAASGCDSVVTVTVQTYPPPVLTGNPGALCTTDPLLQATLTINGASPGSTYEWYLSPDYSNIISSNADSSSVTAAFPPVPANYNFTVIVTDSATTCVDTVFTTIPVVAGVTLTTSSDTAICENDTAALTASGALNYVWTASPPYTFADSSQANQNVSPAVTTTFTVVGVTGVCSDTATIIVTVNPLPPNATISGDTSVCEGDTSIMYSMSPPADSTVWNVTGGTIASGQGSDTIIVDWGSAGPGSILATQYNVFGCPGLTDTLTVTINPLPNTSPIAGPDTVCSGDSAFYSVTNVAGSTYAWTVAGGTPPTGSGSGITVTWGAPGVGTLTVVETNAAGCSDTAVVLSVVINPVPVTPPITGPTPVCEGTIGSIYSVVPPTAGSTYNWVVSANGNITSGQGTNSITVDWITAGSATIIVTETNSSGCPGLPDTFIVTIVAPPTANITGVSPNDTICAGDAVNLSGNATNGTISWTTSGSGTFNNTTIASPTYTSAAADTPMVMLIMTVSNPTCPSAADTIQITVLPLPVPVITGPDPVCENDTGNVYSTTNNPGSVYSWTVAGGTITGGNGSSSITVDWVAAGPGTVTVIEQNADTCLGADTLNIVINPSPVPITITGPDPICEGDTGTYTVTPSTAGNTYTWNVTGGTVLSPGSSTTDIIWTTPGVQTIIVVDTNSFGCPGVADTLNVLVNPLPPLDTIIGPDTVCQNDVALYYVNNTPGSTYSWTVTGGTFVQNGDTISVIWGTPPSDTITVTQTDSNGCTGPAAVFYVVVNPVPNPQTIIGPDTVCEFSTGNIYSVTNNPGNYYIWTVNGGTQTSPNDSTASITVDWDSAGTGTVQVDEYNSFGCRTSNAISVIINGQPTAFATATPDTICANTSVPVQLNGTASNGNVLWQTSGTGTFGDSTLAVTTYMPGASDNGITVLTMIVSNPPCPDSIFTLNLLVIAPPNVNVTTSNSPVDTICLGSSITIYATGGGTYLWSPGGATTDSIIVSPVITGYYSVQVTDTTYGCTVNDSILVSVIQPAVADAGSDMVICNNTSAALSGVILNAGGGVWTTGGDGTFVPDALTLTASYAPGPGDIIAGNVTLVLTTTGNPCVNNNDTVLITLDSFITVIAGPDQTVYRNQTAAISGTVTGTPGGWWTTTGSGTFVPDSISLSATYNPSLNDYNSGFIFLVLHATNACNTAIDSLRLDFPDIIIPNVFTPGPGNTPGYNDFFEILGLPAGSRLEVFNRWGQLVFKADNYRSNWDAAEVTDGTYYYILTTPSPESKSYHGHVRVIKKE